jgi:nucleotide-binding universal stress UspA family protein
MVSFAHVLVPTDGSPLAMHAGAVARTMAERLGARIAVVSVAATGADIEAHERHAAALADALDVDGDSRWVVVAPSAAAGIALVAGDLGATVVCMSSHGHGRSAALVGSVADAVLDELHAPVLLVGPTAMAGAADLPVVATVDGSPQSEASVQVAADWASSLDTDLRVVTVFEPVPEPMSGRTAHRVHGPDGDVDAYLSAVVGRASLSATGRQATAVAVDGPIGAADGLRTWLEEHPAQLVVATTHARTGLRRAIQGSVAARIVHHSPAPVLLVPSAG